MRRAQLAKVDNRVIIGPAAKTQCAMRA